MQFTDLHVHTNYSLLDGLNTPDEYLERAAEIGMTHLAITDHGVLTGHRDFQKSAEKHGITPILGLEAYFTNDRFDRTTKANRKEGDSVYNHMTLLAQNEAGLQNLHRLNEEAWISGFYQKPRCDIELLEEYSDGLIVLSGCMSGPIAKSIEYDMDSMASQWALEFKRIFGERFFIEIMSHNPEKINTGLLHIAEKHGIMPVLTGDCHYAREEDLWLEEANLILSTNPTINKDFDFSKSQKMDMLERFNYVYPDRRMSFQEIEIFLRTAEQHAAELQKVGLGNDLITNTMTVAEMIGDYPYHEALDLLPKPKTDDPDALLEKKARAGLKAIGRDKDEEYVTRLDHELDIIKSMNFSTYFLILANAVSWAKTKDILVGPGRGSGAGSLVNYCLGITGVDPIEHGLLFFRFLDPSRTDWPDIDTDFPDSRRSEVKDYFRRQYKNVASIATFGTFQGKTAVRDASRVFRVNLGEVNKALKGADWPVTADFFSLWQGTENGKEFCKKYPEVLKLAKFLHGRLRSQGMHAGGLVISNQPISNYAPMITSVDGSDEAKNRIPVVSLDMEQCAEIGLVKYDILGLKSLSVIGDTLKLIEKRHGKTIDLYDLTLDDKRVYKSISSGYTRGLFQAEATPYTNMIIKMGGVHNFNELVASNALVRPGAANSSVGAEFIARKNGKTMIEYVHPDAQWFTKDTYGVVGLYQEQVMLCMTELAGMSMSDANKVRKIIGKKRDVREFDEYREKFVEGASQKIPKKIAENLWKDFEAAADYQFNKSHAVAYSMLTYWTAWLKEFYPLEFMVSVLSNEKDKDARLDYLQEIKRMGIRVKLPHVNESGTSFEIQSDERGDFIRFGLTDIKYLSDKLANRLIEKRPFGSYAELHEIVMTKGSGLSTRVLGSLNAIGAAHFPDNPKRGNEKENLFEYLSIPSFEVKDLPPIMKASFRTLGEYDQEETFVTMGMVRAIKTGTGWARVEVVDETGSAGIFTNPNHAIQTGQMYVMLVSKNRIARYISTEDLLSDKGGTFQEFLEATAFPDVPEPMLKVVSFNSRMTKAGKRMADVIFTDEFKNLSSAMVFPQQFMKAYGRLQEGAVVDVQFGHTDDNSAFVLNIL